MVWCLVCAHPSLTASCTKGNAVPQCSGGPCLVGEDLLFEQLHGAEVGAQYQGRTLVPMSAQLQLFASPS
jgi:hypothetical protein